jgi:phosphate transport system protein
MARETLDNKLRHLYDGILVLDSMVEYATLRAVEALKKHDLRAAEKIYVGDKQLNAKRFELENDLIITIATAQPIMASDLRQVASIYEIISELERMGDYAKGIARITIMIGDQPHIKPIIDIPRMADIAVSMLHRAVSAFLANDVTAARIIPQEDDHVDDLYNQVYRELITIMVVNPSAIDQANYLLWAAHNLERLADRVTNICERTIYRATGQFVELDQSDDEAMRFTS